LLISLFSFFSVVRRIDFAERTEQSSCLKAGEFKRGIVQGAAVLFPYKDGAVYLNHRFFKSLAQVQIGGLPFLPGAVDTAENYIRGILKTDGYLTQ